MTMERLPGFGAKGTTVDAAPAPLGPTVKSSQISRSRSIRTGLRPSITSVL
jgi:hypothetical protein